MKTIDDFITADEAVEIASYPRPPQGGLIENEHIRTVAEGSKGWSVLCDFTDTDVSRTVGAFQGDATTVATVPDIYRDIGKRIADSLGISSDHVFFQYISVGTGGRVSAHYDAGMPGYITYKANIPVYGPDPDAIHVDHDTHEVRLRGLYAFEASLYRHWMDASDTPRILLSYGFMLPYKELGLDDNSPRVRLSNRIWKAYISRG